MLQAESADAHMHLVRLVGIRLTCCLDGSSRIRLTQCLCIRDSQSTLSTQHVSANNLGSLLPACYIVAAVEALEYLLARVQADYNVEAGEQQQQRRAVTRLVKPLGAPGEAAKNKAEAV